MLFFSGGGRSLTGVDIGASAIKVISGKKQKTAFQVDKLAIVPLAHKCVDDRGILDAESVLAALLSAFEQIGLNKADVATAVHGSGVLTKKIILSHFPKKEIPDQVRWEAEQVFPADAATIFTDYLLLGEVKNIPGAPVGTPGWEILLIGVRQESVVALNNVLSAAACNVKVIDLDTLAMADLLQDLLAIPTKETTAFVDIGASGTRVFVRQNAHVVFIREFQIGGNAFTEAIAQTLGLSFADAESIKIQDGSGIPQEAQDALQLILQNWKSEIQQSEDVFVTQDSHSLIKRWVLMGGGTQTPGLIASLRDEHFGEKTVVLPAQDLLVAGNKNVDESILQSWSSRLISAAALACRKSK